MASFKTVNLSWLDGKYEGGIKVYLESAEDVSTFSDHWFSDQQDKLRFVSAEEGKKGGGGCRVVIHKVEEAAQNNIKAFGIVDRDVLLSENNLDLFWEADDEKFHSAQPYGDRIHVLRRWELENYLLVPDAFKVEIHRRTPRPFDVSAETFFQCAEDIIQVTALTTYLVANGKKSPNPAFGTNIKGTLSEEIGRHLEKQFSPEAADISEDVKKIKRFDELNSHDPQRKWDRLSRMLDGKKSLMRLCYYLGTESGISGIGQWEEMRGCLASNIASMQKVDLEISNVLNEIKNRSWA